MRRQLVSIIRGCRDSILPVVLAAMMLSVCGCMVVKAESQDTMTNKMQIQGKISVKGNTPHTYLCLSTVSGTDYRLEGGLKDLLWSQYQQEEIRLEGVISKKAIGPGAPAEFIVHQILTQSQ